MNPGSVFERVYRSIKAELLRGAYRPGETLEPRSLAEQHVASVTPIRDALHRLAGERLIEASLHDGFRVPLMTENGLRDLYGWQEQLGLLSMRLARAPASKLELAPAGAADRARHVFASLASLTGSTELQIANEQASERLEPVRLLEPAFLPDLDEELSGLELQLAAQAWPELRPLLLRYRARRLRIVPHLVTALHQSPANP